MADQDHLVQTVFKAQDDLTPVLRAIQQGLDQTRTSLAALQAPFAQLSEQATQNTAFLAQAASALQALQQGQQASVGSTSELAAASLAMAQATQQQTQGYVQAQAAAGQFRQEQAVLARGQREATAAARESTAAWQGFASTVAAFGVATSLNALVSQLVSIGKSVIVVGTQLEGLRLSFAGVFGSQAAGAMEMARVLDLSNRLGLSTMDLATSYRNFAAATRGTAIEGDETRKIFESITIAGRGLGVSNEALTRGLIALQQMVSKGTVSMEELKGQLSEALPGAFQVAARALGMTTKELSDFVGKGEAEAIPFVTKLAEQFRKELGGGVAASAASAGSAFQRLSNELDQAKSRIAESGLLDILKNMAEYATKILAADRQTTERLAFQMGPAPAGLPDQASEAMQRQFAALEEARRKYQELLTGGISVTSLMSGDLSSLLPPSPEEVQAALSRLRELERGWAATLAAQQRRLAESRANAAMFDSPGVNPSVTEAATRNAAAKKALDDLDTKLRELETRTKGLLAGQDAARAKLLTEEAREARAKLIDETLPDVFGPKALGGMALGGMAQGMADKAILARAIAYGKERGVIEEVTEAEATAEKARDAATRKAVRDQAQHEEAGKRLVAQLRAQAEQVLLSSHEAEAAALREQIAQQQIPPVYAEQALALLQKAQAARDATELAKVNAEEEKRLLEDEAKAIEAIEKARKDTAAQRTKAQERYNDRIADTLRLLQAPDDQRLSTRLRNQAGPLVGDLREADLAEVDLRYRQRRQATEIEKIGKDMARSLERTFENLWEQVFSGGITSAKDFASVVVQSIQRAFAQLSAQIMTVLLNIAVNGPGGGGEGALGGVASMITKWVTGVATGGSGSTTPQGPLLPNGEFFSRGGFLTDAGLGFTSQNQQAASAGVQPLSAAGFRLRRVTTPSFGFVGSGIGPGTASPMAGPAGMARSSGPRSGSAQAGEPAPIIIHLNQDFSGAIDPRALRTTPAEVIAIVAKDISQDGPTRRVIVRHTGGR